MIEQADQVMEAVRRFAPEFSARAGEGEALRTMPADLVDRVRHAGLFRLNLPRSLGGLELDLATTVRAFEELSRADGSGGWTVMIGNSTAFFAWLDPEVAARMIGGSPDFSSTSMFGPFGQAVPDGAGGFTVSGRWPFNSGCPHAEWSQVGVFVMDGGAPRMRTPGLPDWRFAFIPTRIAKIEDTWDAGGLRGTGSHHLSLQATRVPAEHLVAPIFDDARHEGPMWKIPFFALVGVLMSAFPLGVARRAIDEFTQLAGPKVRAGAIAAIGHDGHAQVQLAVAEAGLAAARSLVYETIADIWETVCHGDHPSLDQRGRVLLASGQAMRAGIAAVEGVFRLAGAEAVFSDQPLQRCLRDMHAAGQHVIYGTGRDQAFSKLRLGLNQPTFTF